MPVVWSGRIWGEQLHPPVRLPLILVAGIWTHQGSEWNALCWSTRTFLAILSDHALVYYVMWSFTIWDLLSLSVYGLV